MRRIVAFLTLALSIFGTSHALAWNSFGHMTVAAIAYEQLTPAARTKADALLKLNPNYKDWVAGVADADKDKVAFVMAATWPDFIKHAKGYKNDGEIPKGPDVAKNVGYSDKLMHKYWHYIDLPFSPDGTKLIQAQVPNAKTQIADFRKTLGSATASDELKSYDLVWLIHLVGDVHQPLHSAQRFTKDLPDGDAGGNKVMLCAKPCKVELHAFWDDLIGTSNSPTAAIKAAGKIKAAPANQAAISDEAKWIDESFQAAKKNAYAAPIGVGGGPFALDQAYKTAAKRLARQRVALAGARLANLINDALK